MLCAASLSRDFRIAIRTIVHYFDGECKSHREVGGSLRNMLTKSFGDEHHGDRSDDRDENDVGHSKRDLHSRPRSNREQVLRMHDRK